MEFKKVVAENTRLAMSQIKKELGEDAFIVSSKVIDNGVEVIAGVSTDNDTSKIISEDAAEMLTHNHSSDNNKDILALQGEFKTLKSLVEEQLSTLVWSDEKRKNAAFVYAVQQLMKRGFDSSVAHQLAYGIDDGNLETIKAIIEENFKKRLAIDSSTLLEQGKNHIFLGPSGAGKSMTIVKLLANYVLRFDPDLFSVITLDVDHLGSVEVLQTYGKILKVPIRIIEKTDDLGKVLAEFSKKNLVLIDTAGISPQQTDFLEKYSDILSQTDVFPHLLIPASGSLNYMKDIISLFPENIIKSCILTKVDEVSLLGESMSAILESKIPLQYICDGNDISKNIHLATMDNIMTTCLGDKFNEVVEYEQA